MSCTQPALVQIVNDVTLISALPFWWKIPDKIGNKPIFSLYLAK